MSGNGVDLAAIYQAIIAISSDLKTFKAEITADIAALKAEIREFKRDVAGEFFEIRAELRTIKGELRVTQGEVADLRQTLNDYHGSVIGHGILLTELDERLTRLEQRSA